MSKADDVAAQRFALMNLARFASVALVFLGIANIAGKLLPEAKPLLGYALFFLGVGGFYGLPIVLKRRWRTGDE
ncbi:MAG: hypothetical protein ACKOAN_07205 [Chakrabartia sp.]